jgi:uncharacterized phage protein (TIGR01671 family)
MKIETINYMTYRGWDKNKKKFIYNFAIDARNGAPTIIHMTDELNNYINEYYSRKGDDMWGDYGVLDFTDWYAINDVEINKSTGYKDGNEKDIYENDIVEYMLTHFTVKFVKGCFLLENDTKKIWWHELLNMSTIIIIGNIYEQRKTKLNILNKI